VKVYLVTAMNKFNKLCFTEEYFTESQAQKEMQQLKNLGYLPVMHIEEIDPMPSDVNSYIYGSYVNNEKVRAYSA